MESADLRSDLKCSICLEVYKHPVTLRCGHNFCLACVRSLLYEPSEFFTCPECRKKFRSSPELHKNITLSRIAERFNKDLQEEELTTVFCSYCDFAVPAARSCQQCETSLCADHLRKHNRTVEHVLLPPMADLGKRRCPVHGKILEYYCTKDSVCVCASCRLDGEHRGHQSESLEEASERKLRPLLDKVIYEREKTEKRIQSLQEYRARAQEVAANVTKMATAELGGLKKQLEDLEKKVFGGVSRWEMQISQTVSDVIQQLQTNKDELSQKIGRLERLRDQADPLSVLGDQEVVKDLHDTGKQLPIDPEFPDLQKDLTFSALCKLSDAILSAKMWIQKPADILLDVSTASDSLWISDDLKSALRSEIKRHYPKLPDRLQHCGVLSCGSFSSWHHYWGVDTSQSDSWRVGMCYPSINRKNRISIIGRDGDSWCLQRLKQNYKLMHNGEYIPLPHKPASHKFCIYLDFDAGQLSFYEVGDLTRHLHTFKATFSEPLHAVLGVFQGSITISN